MKKRNPSVRVKQKYQVTIPVSIRKKLSLQEGDTLEIQERDGVLLLIPQMLVPKDRAAAQKVAIDRALEEAQKGKFISQKAMRAWVDSWDTPHELPEPEVDIFVDQKKNEDHLS